MSKVTVPIVLLMSFVLVVLTSLGIALKIIRNKFVELSTAWILIFYLSINLALLCTYYLFGSQFPANRKFLFMVPIISYSICKGLDCYLEYKYFKPAISAIIIFSIIHMLSIKPMSTREWWYDATTKQIIEDLDKKFCYDKQCKLGTNWMFHPSSTYYITTGGLNNIQLSDYNKALKRSETDDFFICFNSDFETLKDKYVVLEAYSYSVYLLKAKD